MLLTTANSISIIRLLIVLQVTPRINLKFIVHNHVFLVWTSFWGRPRPPGQAHHHFSRSYCCSSSCDRHHHFYQERYYPTSSTEIFVNNDYLEAITSNLISFMTNRELNNRNDIIRISSYILGLITIVNVITTFIFIHTYLKFKHSRSIEIAERANLNKSDTLISFKKLVAIAVCSGLLVFSNYQIHHSDFVWDNSKIPPLCYVVNFITLIVSLLFLFSKQDIVKYLKRRISNWSLLSFVGESPQNNTRVQKRDQAKRRQAWA